MKKISILGYDSFVFFLVRGIFIGTSLNNLISLSKQDSYISMIIGIILSLFPIYIFYYIKNKYPKDNILEINKKVFGVVLGSIINLITTIFIFILTSFLLWNIISFISSQYLYRTPTFIILLFTLIPIYYILKFDINTISRVSIIFFYIVILFYILTIIGLIFNSDLTNLLPFMRNNIIKGTISYIAYNTLPLYLLLIIPKNKIDHSNKILSNTFLFYLIGAFSILGVLLLVLTIYGANMASILEYPEFHMLMKISIPGLIERVENILSLQWFLDTFIILVLTIYFIKQYINTITTYKNGYKFVFILLFFVSLNFFKSSSQNLEFFNNLIPYIYIVFLLVPILIAIKKDTKVSIL